MTFRIRPATPDDFDAIYEMAKLTGGGFTNLPPDRAALGTKLERAEAGFARASPFEAGNSGVPYRSVVSALANSSVHCRMASASAALTDGDAGTDEGECRRGLPVAHRVSRREHRIVPQSQALV